MNIFVLVDYQKDFVSGSLGFEKAQELDCKIADRIRRAYAEGETVICTMDTHCKNYLQTQEGKKLPVPHCIEESEGWQVFGETRKALEDGEHPAPIYVKKPTFGSKKLGEVLEELVGNAACRIELGGVVTNMCVLSNAVIAKAFLPEAEIVVNSQLCASFDEALHTAALDVMKNMQMTII